MKRKLSTLIPSCDAYADTWDPFFHFFWKHWPDCPFDVYLGSNCKDYNDSRIEVIKVGDDVSWSDSIRKMLERLDTPYVLLFLEDYFIYDCSSDKILETFDAFIELDAKYMQLTPTPRPDRKVPGYPMLGEIKKGARYRTAIGLEFWDVKTFLSLLEKGETAWEMESKGSERASNLDGFYRTWEPLVRYHNAIVCGTWRRHALAYCNKNGITVDTSLRPVFSVAETLWISIKSFVRRFISILPETLFEPLFTIGRKTLRIYPSVFKRGRE